MCSSPDWGRGEWATNSLKKREKWDQESLKNQIGLSPVIMFLWHERKQEGKSTFLNDTIKYETRVRMGCIFNQASFLLSSMSPCASVLALSHCLLDGEHAEEGGELLYVSPSSQYYTDTGCCTLHTPLVWSAPGAPETYLGKFSHLNINVFIGIQTEGSHRSHLGLSALFKGTTSISRGGT